MIEIHPTAVVETGAQLGFGCRICAYAVVGAQVRLGPDNVIGPHVVIEGRTSLGSGNRLLQFASVGAGPQADDWAGEPAALEIGADNVIRESVTLHGSVGGAPTRIGDRNLFMAGGAMVVQDVPPFCTVQGDRARLAGLNLVGLQRAGLDPQTIAGLRRAYRLLFLGTLPMAERIAAVRALDLGPEAERLVRSLATSRRGAISTPRRAAA